MKIHLVRDSAYAPCSILIVQAGAEYHNEESTILVQTDWDFPALAYYFGWDPLKTTSPSAWDFLVDCADLRIEIEDPGYFSGKP